MGMKGNESSGTIIELSMKIFSLAKATLMLEEREKSSILFYSIISECASEILAIAEERRQTLARVQWDGEVSQNLRTLSIGLFS
jgi:hypothetical protein